MVAVQWYLLELKTASVKTTEPPNAWQKNLYTFPKMCVCLKDGRLEGDTPLWALKLLSTMLICPIQPPTRLNVYNCLS